MMKRGNRKLYKKNSGRPPLIGFMDCRVKPGNDGN